MSVSVCLLAKSEKLCKWGNRNLIFITDYGAKIILKIYNGVQSSIKYTLTKECHSMVKFCWLPSGISGHFENKKKKKN